jgi:phosphoglycerol transferase
MSNYFLLIISFILYVVAVKKYLQNNKLTKHGILFISAVTLLYTCYSICFLASDYFTDEGINDAVVFHVMYGLEGAGYGEYAILILVSIVSVIASFIIPFVSFKHLSCWLYRGNRNSKIAMIYVIILLSFIINPVFYNVIKIYFDTNPASESTKFSGDLNTFYKTPKIEQQGQAKNLVYIYAESFERSYFDETVFPGLIKELRALESKATSFTQIKQVSGTGWTIAGMTASQCGIPLITPSHGNSMSGMDKFLPNAVCLGDLLADEGYSLSFLSGSSLEFAGTQKLFSSHGFENVAGKNILKNKLKNPSDINQWGLYDDSLFKIAFKEFMNSSKKEEPFAMFLATMDTHHPQGHVSKTCTEQYQNIYQNGDNPILNAVACSDHLIGSFVKKILDSKYKDNTIIVISSDHSNA